MIIKSIELGLENNVREHMTPSLLIKTGGCNVQCVNKENELCPFSNSKVKSISYSKAKKILEVNPQISQIVIDGGEPLIYKNEIEKMLNDIYTDGMKIVIKTNGTLPILNPLSKNYKISLYDVYIPGDNFPVPGEKYGEVIYGTNEIENMRKSKVNISNLLNIALYSSDYVFNFEVNNEDQLDFVDNIISSLYEKAGSDEFTNNFLKKYPIEKHIAVYTNKYTEEKLQEICIKRGWNISAKNCNK